ncbi:MAG: hypothetical protein FJ008_01440 [Chloroflexi bacterium]|nr:hypothetical protein [Chloroflexota bacterium]MBM3153978.1 hypothetical protein [Chloroflexota bacterium]MBM3173672.1 hypothetical protein [Chloroflexota bacterium]MBM3174278.1 hypothetical protein [Chloroflexota bacterium]MBM4449627.1 hypothetical protein [Chloroflexota bacterium]
MAENKEGKGRKRGFYSHALDEAEQVELEEAREIEGLDEEIAMLRLRLREILVAEPERFDLHLRMADVIARMVKTRYHISKEQKKSLKQAIAKVLTEIAIPLGVKVLVK